MIIKAQCILHKETGNDRHVYTSQIYGISSKVDDSADSIGVMLERKREIYINHSVWSDSGFYTNTATLREEHHQTS